MREALARSSASVTLRGRRLALAANDPQRMRDLAIRLAPHAELLGRAGRHGEACNHARETLALWNEIRRRGHLGALDRLRGPERRAA